ncbi:hypothetical protein N0V83_008717 [Neocucurbitaria cava]|uniref:Xylanolytic transcriptional activator regulatory domain-containing protein n=1 Tax=Neocucurbitaria cava TaxID=798079 RepID=A0A9W8Y1L9_9PLEO|nr:hypothetical protein N0V83_008717 [Neocucurbitaria cava]
MEDIGQRNKEPPLDVPASNAVDKILHAIPPRSITGTKDRGSFRINNNLRADTFVNHFLTVVNYRYNAIYRPTLTDQYVQWWADRAAGKPLSPEFTCLLLRICAYSVQYLSPALRKMIEFELACNSQTLTERFTSAADQLSQSFEASTTRIERVQEQFLKAVWLKSESKIVESWHTLGRTIREAQELGIDKDAGIDSLPEFDIEIRRRIWTLLYIWDWQMSAWLGRPNLIDQKNLTFNFPNLRLDQSTTEPKLLSPFAHIVLQAQLARRIATIMGEAQPHTNLSAEQVLAIESECEKFMEELPAVFKITETDKSLDEQYPYFVFQRHQLHCVIFLAMLDVLKPYLTRDRRDKLTDRDDELRKMGVDIALRLLEVSRDLFDHEFPINAKFHMVAFSIFDTATLLCSAIIHDQDHILPRREAVIDIINNSLDMLHQLSLTTKLGAASYSFLSKLVQATPELSRHSPGSKRQKQRDLLTPSTSSSSLAISTMDHMEPLTGTKPPEINLVPSVTITDDLSFDLDQFLAQNPFGNPGSTSALDMGGMEQIWDWENLHLDGFSNNGSVV